MRGRDRLGLPVDQVRVLQVIPSLAHRTGGTAVVAVQIAKALDRCGIENAVYSTDMAHSAQTGSAEKVTPAELVPGASEVELRLFPARPPHRFAYSPALARELRRDVGSYDVVHLHSIYLHPVVAGYREARRSGVPHVVSPHGSLDPWHRAQRPGRKAAARVLWLRRMLGSAAALHFTTDDEARLASQVAPDVPRMVVPAGIDLDEFEKLPAGGTFRARHLGGHGGPVVINIGRLTEKKGHDVLIAGFAMVVRELPEARLVLAGPDEEGLQPTLAGLAEEHGVLDEVVFTGMLRGEEKLAALAAADVWALPSLTENFGVAVLEALASGVPVVVSPAVNISGELAAARAGVVCRRTPEAFAHEIRTLLLDERRRSELAERGRAFAERFDAAALAPRWAELYAAAAGEGS